MSRRRVRRAPSGDNMHALAASMIAGSAVAAVVLDNLGRIGAFIFGGAA